MDQAQDIRFVIGAECKPMAVLVDNVAWEHARRQVE